MSDTPDFDADPSESTVEPSAAAIGLALGAAENHLGIAADAREFLQKQSRCLDLQMEDLHEQRDLTSWISIFENRRAVSGASLERIVPIRARKPRLMIVRGRSGSNVAHLWGIGGGAATGIVPVASP
jgi:hypothetical protein